MSTRSQMRRNNQQESTENVGENLVSPVLIQNEEVNDHDAIVLGAPHAPHAPHAHAPHAKSLGSKLAF